MPRRIGIDYQGVELQRMMPVSPDSIVLRSLGRQELKGMIEGNLSLWGPDEHYNTDGGYRGEPKPGDSGQGEMIMAYDPNLNLPPDGEGNFDKIPSAEDIDRMIGDTLVGRLITA